MINPVRQYFYTASPSAAAVDKKQQFVYATSPDTSDNAAEHKEDWRTAWFFGSNIDHHFTTAGGGERAFKEVACATVASFLVSPMVSIIGTCHRNIIIS